MAAAAAAKVEEPAQLSVQKMELQSEDEDGDRAGGQGDIQPVGHDYVEEVGREGFPSPVIYCILYLEALQMEIIYGKFSSEMSSGLCWRETQKYSLISL